MLSYLLRHLRETFRHSRDLFRLNRYKPLLTKYGLAFVIIMIVWEIVEDAVLPGAFAWMGANLHPAFYALVPLPWIFCFNIVLIPVLWNLYLAYLGKGTMDKNEIRNDLH